MARVTSFILVGLGFCAIFLIGIKVGTKLPKDIALAPTLTPSPVPTLTDIPTPTLAPTSMMINASPTAASKSNVQGASTSTTTINGVSIYTDKSCGFSFTYNGSYLNSKSVNGQATIITDPNDPKAAIAVTCLESIPRPPVSSDHIESITVAGVAATLYHDTNKDIVIFKHPKTGKEILLAGVNPLFSAVLASLKLI
jgi:hypothetical protein